MNYTKILNLSHFITVTPQGWDDVEVIALVIYLDYRITEAHHKYNLK